jgi:predicted MFS family arabinose efflux permease
MGRLNLCIGIFGLCAALGATISTTLAGWIADAGGESLAFVALAAAGLAGTALLWAAMPETEPGQLGSRQLKAGHANGQRVKHHVLNP